ncbi:helix-turn-helix domain-containing protein [Mycobacterium sp. 141]|uniref:helix-turn-helix domain-containing protein n=1 Tax=Mycobacterium sp. 141 TaxID=1120797 RepID=UPI00210197C2|nr:helix-turn-helix domain-containing protein [Mycobacterium sp. 141]
MPEAASELRICRSNFYQLMSRGEIRTLKLGSRTLIQYKEIVRFIDELNGAGSWVRRAL